MNTNIGLPALKEVQAEEMVDTIVQSLGFPRSVLATTEDISLVWSMLKSEIDKVRTEYRHEMLARMVVAIRVGLFSSAVNEMWNTTILVIREKIRNFGLTEANQFLTSKLNEKTFKEVKDKELLDISVELGLLSEDSYFFLNHCREIRNNYSSAHPSVSMLDGSEMQYFIHQCVKHVLSNEVKYVGFRSDEFISVISSTKLDKDAKSALSKKIIDTNEIQRTAILKALFGIYVDETNGEPIRQNCLELSRINWDYFSEQAKSEIVAMYSGYLVQDNTKKQYSKFFFEKVNAIDLLPKDEQISLVNKILKQLEGTHFDMNNFYNEAAFAERLVGIHKQIPAQLRKEYVYVVSLCYIGNSYGTASSAEDYYEQMIQDFTVREIDKLFDLLQENNYLRMRVNTHQRCRKKLNELLVLFNEESVPSKWKDAYLQLLKK